MNCVHRDIFSQVIIRKAARNVNLGKLHLDLDQDTVLVRNLKHVDGQMVSTLDWIMKCQVQIPQEAEFNS